MKQDKKIALAAIGLLGLLSGPFCFAQVEGVAPVLRSGHESSGGGYINQEPKDWLKESAREMAQVVSRSKSELVADETKRSILVRALQPSNLVMLDTTSRQRNGVELVLDYNLTEQRIEVLKGFFDQFNTKDDELKDKVIFRNKLLHEVAHLIGIGIQEDDDATRFAEEIIQKERENETRVTLFYQLKANGVDTIFKAYLGDQNFKFALYEKYTGYLENVSIGSGSLAVDLEMGGFNNTATLELWVVKNDGSRLSLTRGIPIEIHGKRGIYSLKQDIKFDPSQLNVWKY